MNDLGAARRILSMNILRDIKKGSLWLTRSDYISRMLKRFKVENIREVSTPLAIYFKLSVAQRPQTEEESREMKKIPYANIVGSIM